jgi:hypothetical protein
VIPQGAIITAAATALTPTDSLTVNGSLTTSTLVADNTLLSITVGDGGSFVNSNSSGGLNTTKVTEITVGKGATFDVTGGTSSTYEELKTLTVGEGSTFEVGDAATFAKLKTLSVGAGSEFTAGVAVANEAPLTSLTLGKDAVVSAAGGELIFPASNFDVTQDVTLDGVVIPASGTLTVNAGVTLTVPSTGTIGLAGHGTPGKLVLANKVGTVAAGGGGKLVLAGSTATKSTDLGTDGVIKIVATATTENLTATGEESGSDFTFLGTAAARVADGITNITNTAAPFKSIEAATVEEANKADHGTVILQGAGSGTAVIGDDTALKSSS